MSKKENGVLYVKYKDDEEAKNGRGIAVHLYQDVKHYGFLVIEHYEKYEDGTVMGKKKAYIPKGAINTCTVYESYDYWEQHLNELFKKRMLEND